MNICEYRSSNSNARCASRKSDAQLEMRRRVTLTGSDGRVRNQGRWVRLCSVGAIVALAACDRGSARTTDDGRVVSPEKFDSEPSIAVSGPEITVRAVEIGDWNAAPAACDGPRSDAAVRAETAAAVAAFTRWVALVIDPVRHNADAPWYLQDLRRIALKDGMTMVLVPPSGYEVVWDGVTRATSLDVASRAAPAVAAVRLQVKWAVERGPGASPVRGYLSTAAYQNSQSWGLYGVFVEFCVTPPVGGVSVVYLRYRGTA